MELRLGVGLLLTALGVVDAAMLSDYYYDYYHPHSYQYAYAAIPQYRMQVGLQPAIQQVDTVQSVPIAQPVLQHPIFPVAREYSHPIQVYSGYPRLHVYEPYTGYPGWHRRPYYWHPAWPPPPWHHYYHHPYHAYHPHDPSYYHPHHYPYHYNALSDYPDYHPGDFYSPNPFLRPPYYGNGNDEHGHDWLHWSHHPMSPYWRQHRWQWWPPGHNPHWSHEHRSWHNHFGHGYHDSYNRFYYDTDNGFGYLHRHPSGSYSRWDRYGPLGAAGYAAEDWRNWLPHRPFLAMRLLSRSQWWSCTKSSPQDCLHDVLDAAIRHAHSSSCRHEHRYYWAPFTPEDDLERLVREYRDMPSQSVLGNGMCSAKLFTHRMAVIANIILAKAIRYCYYDARLARLLRRYAARQQVVFSECQGFHLGGAGDTVRRRPVPQLSPYSSFSEQDWDNWHRHGTLAAAGLQGVSKHAQPIRSSSIPPGLRGAQAGGGKSSVAPAASLGKAAVIPASPPPPPLSAKGPAAAALTSRSGAGTIAGPVRPPALVPQSAVKETPRPVVLVPPRIVPLTLQAGAAALAKPSVPGTAYRPPPSPPPLSPSLSTGPGVAVPNIQPLRSMAATASSGMKEKGTVRGQCQLCQKRVALLKSRLFFLKASACRINHQMSWIAEMQCRFAAGTWSHKLSPQEIAQIRSRYNSILWNLKMQSDLLQWRINRIVRYMAVEHCAVE